MVIMLIKKCEYLSDVIVFEGSSPKFVDVKMEPNLSSTTVILCKEYVDLINRIIELEKKLLDNKFPENIITSTNILSYGEVKKYEVDNDINIKHYFFIEKYVSNFWRMKPKGYYGIATMFFMENDDFVITVSRNQNLKNLNNKKFSNCKKYIIEFKKLNPNVASKLKAKTVKIRDIIYDNIYHLNYKPIDLYIPKFIRIAVNNINNRNNIFVKNITLETSSLKLFYDNDIYDYDKKSNEYLKTKFGWKFFFLEEEKSYFTYEKIKNIIKEPFKIKLHISEKEKLKMMIMYPELFSK